MTMFLLEKRTGQDWRPIYRCAERWPLEWMLKHLPRTGYRIIEKRKPL